MSLIVAMSGNRCIGNNNQLMWHLRDDMLNFKRVTSGKPVIMGRKTYESIGRPLPSRHNIVISRQAGLRIEGCVVCRSVQQARDNAEQWCSEHSVDEYFVIGGAEIYNQTLDQADKLYLTLINEEFEGDAWFPSYEHLSWSENNRIEGHKGAQNDCDFSILELHRKA